MPTISLIPIDQIDPHPANPRHDLGDLDELADSIKAHGVQQNLLIVPKTSDATAIATGRVDRWTVVIGHRRLAAARLAGLTKIPAAVDDTLTDAQQIELMLLENVQRTNLTPIEEAEGYQGLLDLGVKVRAIAQTTGRAEKTITARLRLLKLPDAAQAAVHSGQATLEDAARLQQLVDGTNGDVPPTLLKKVSAALGTTNFDWELRTARTTIENRQRTAEIIARLDELGVPKATAADGLAAPAGYQWWRYLSGPASLDDVPDGAVWTKSGSNVTVWRPSTALEQTQADGAAAARAFDEQIEAEGEIARELRDVFVRGFVARKKLTRDQIDTITATVAPLVIAGQLDDVWRLAEWFGEETHYRSADQKRDLIAEHLPDTHPASLLLLAFHLSTLRCPWSFARGGLLAELYRLLEALGYTMSDAERGRVFPPDDKDQDDEDDVDDAAAGDQEPACQACGHSADDHDIDTGECGSKDGLGVAVCRCDGLTSRRRASDPMPPNNSPARRAQRRQTAHQRRQAAPLRASPPAAEPRPYPNPSKARYRTHTAAQRAVRETRRRDDPTKCPGPILPYRCECGAWHIGHARKPRRSTREEDR